MTPCSREPEARLNQGIGVDLKCPAWRNPSLIISKLEVSSREAVKDY